jgi:hypothetical protein
MMQLDHVLAYETKIPSCNTCFHMMQLDHGLAYETEILTLRADTESLFG